MRHWGALILLLWGPLAPCAPAFRVHLTSEPGTLDPHKQKSATSSYVTQNLFRNLFYDHPVKGLTPELAEGCHRESQDHVLICQLKKNLKWSDGQKITAKDFIAAYQRVLDPKTGSFHADSLFEVVNAEEIYKHHKKLSELGISAPNDHTIKFTFVNTAPEFEERLASSTLAPFREDFTSPEKMPTSGPYKILAWTRGDTLQLTANANYQGGNPRRPDVEFRFIEDDDTALKLFEKGQLDFLRRLPTAFVPAYQGRPEFHWIPVLRMDYIGFGPSIRKNASLREALSLALNYPEMQKLFHSEGRPGCPGVPEDWFDDHKVPCLDFNVKQAQDKAPFLKPTLEYRYSTQGGDDHRRATDWEQEQWRKNLDITIHVKAMENKVFLSELKDNPPDLFRKGLAADRPTCLALLENLMPGHSENYGQINDVDFIKAVTELQNSPDAKIRRQKCQQALQTLLDHHLLIPLGRWSFAILVKNSFTGWELNELNQLDLSNLQLNAQH